jgi:hypothetical protein
LGWLTVSARDLQRIEVLTEVLAGRRTTASAAIVLDMSVRQTQRLLTRYRDGGGGALIHKARGRASNYQLSTGIRDYALELIRQSYRDFGPTLAAEILLERHGLQVSRETLRKWMVEAELWLSRKQRRTFHQPRLRREHYGELIQIDGSEHRWREDRGAPCTPLVFIDDATSRLMRLRFVPSEGTDSYVEALSGYLDAHGCPVAFYSDKHSVFRINKQEAKGGQGMTQFGRALAELNIEILCANSSQAKGRVERANRTLQDRLVKELRLAGICDIDAGNTFLRSFLARFNQRFAIPPSKPRTCTATYILQRAVSATSCATAGSAMWARSSASIMTASGSSSNAAMFQRPSAASNVELYDFIDRPMEVRWKGVSLPYRVFSKDQRVSHTAIVENDSAMH